MPQLTNNQGESRRSVWVRRLCGSRFSRRKRWLFRSACAAVLGLLVLWIVLTHSSVTARIVLPQIARALGVELDAQRVVITIDGRVLMEGVEARVPDIDHAAATFFRVDRLAASVDWSTAILSGEPAIERIILTNPTVRISQSVEDQRLNVATLKLVSSAAGELDLPTIIAQNAIVEVGEHSSTKYTALRRLFLAGELTPAAGPVQAYDVNLREAGPSIAFPGSPTGLRIAGRIDDDGAEITLRGIRLDGIAPSAVPSPIRNLYADLDLKGSVTQARFNYSHQRGVVATMVLDGVDITPPVPPERLESGATRPMRMHGTSGTISLSQSGLRASLSGTIEDLPYEVEVDYMGVSANSPFTATLTTRDFTVSENPDLLPYAPRIVRKRMANFSNPTALVDAQLTISRGEPTEDGPAPLEADGRLEFTNGVAAFDKFPYPFEDMTARVHFTDERIVIEEVKGRSPSGADLRATALIEPLTPHAFVNVDIVVEDVPIDALLLECLGPGRRQLADAILSHDEYQRLLAAGVIAAQPGDEAPHFELGGVGDMIVNVQREHGDGDIWHVLVDVRFDEVGFLVDRFPYPIVGRDVLLRIDDDRVELIGGEFSGIEGGFALVEAEAVYVRGENGGTYVPKIRVEAGDVPLGDLIASALPDAPLGDSGVSPRSIVQALGMGGAARASIDVFLRDDGELGYDAAAAIEHGTSTPSPLEGSAPIVVHDIAASIVSSEDSLEVTASALAGANDPARIAVDISSTFGQDTTSRVRASNVDATMALESYVAIFSEKAARELRDTRVTLKPEGRVDLDVLSVSADGPATTTVEVSVPGAASFDLFDGRIAMSDVTGSAVIEASEDPRIEFRSTRGFITYDDGPAGVVAMNGRVPLAALGKRPAPDVLPDDLGALRLEADGALLESGLARWIVASYLPGGALDLYDEHQPRGVVDADVTMTTIVDENGNYTWDPEGVLRPRHGTILRRGLDVPLTAGGDIRFGRTWGEFQGATVAGPSWSGEFSGAWRAGAAGISYDATIDIEATSLTEDLRAMLVSELIEKLDVIDVKIDGPISMKGARVEGLRTGDDETSEISFHGDIEFVNASATPGAEITEASGAVDVGFELAPARGPPAYEMAFAVDRMRAAKVRLTEGRALILSADRERELLMPHFSAKSHAGRLSASTHIWPVSTNPDGDLHYRTDLRLSGVRFGPLLADFSEPDESGPESGPDEAKSDEADDAQSTEVAEAGQEPDPWLVNDDRSRGVMEAGITIGGVVGETQSRRGSGVIEILGGNVLQLPALIVQLIEISNLQPPANEKLDYATASFFIDGDFIGFEDLSVFSKTVSILGSGSLDWGAREVDLSFHTRAARRIPMLSQIIEGIRDELATATIRGPIDDYELRMEQFPGDSALLESLFSARRKRARADTRQTITAPLTPSVVADDEDQ